MAIDLVDPWQPRTVATSQGSAPGPRAAWKAALPMVLAAGLVAWLGHRGAAVSLVAVAVAAVVLAALAPATWARVAGVLDRGARALGRAAVGIVVGIVALPLLYLPGAVARIAGRVRRAIASPSRGWLPASSTAVRRRDARRPFIAPPPAVARRRHLASLGVVVALVGAILLLPEEGNDVIGTRRARDAPQPTASREGGSLSDRLDAVPFSRRPAMAGVDFADALQEQTYRTAFAPDEETGYRLEDLRTPLVNIRGGERATAASRCEGCPRARLWLVGGSLVFGIGQRDDHTIASELVRLAAADGVGLEVRNQGVPGWTIAQEAAALRRAEDPPSRGDVVVFLDGFNDTVAVLIQLWATSELPAGPVLLDAEKADALFGGSDEVPAFDPRAYGRLAAERYRQTASAIDSELRARGVVVAHLVQPDASSSPVQRRAVEQLGVFPPDFYASTQLDAALRSFAGGVADLSVDLRGLFDDLRDPVFLDTSHVNERGASRIAAAVYRVVREPVIRAAG